MNDPVLHIAEIVDPSGYVKFRYSRYLSPDGTRWIRHGLFIQYYPSGGIASEGLYEHGDEQGSWKDFFESGLIAAEGQYAQGREDGLWRYFAEDGTLEREAFYENGQERS